MNKKKLRVSKFLVLLVAGLCFTNMEAITQQSPPDKINKSDTQTVNSDEVVEPSAVSEEEVNANPSNPSNANVTDISRMSLREFNLSLIILAFGFIVLLAEFFLLRSVSCNAEQLLRIFGITLIVMGSLLIIPAGFNAEAIAPAMGLLGTIAGYLLSQRSGTSNKEVEKSNQ